MASAHTAAVYFWAFSCEWPAYLTLCAVNFTLQTLVHAQQKFEHFYLYSGGVLLITDMHWKKCLPRQ